MAYFEAVKKLEAGGADDVPNHLKDSSRDKKGLGHGAGYKYPHAFREHWVAQQYLPRELQGEYFYEASDSGAEKDVKIRVDRLRLEQEAEAEKPLKGESSKKTGLPEG
jgi:putative ATPase